MCYPNAVVSVSRDGKNIKSQNAKIKIMVYVKRVRALRMSVFCDWRLSILTSVSVRSRNEEPDSKYARGIRIE
jgi:hypothetical protein